MSLDIDQLIDELQKAKAAATGPVKLHIHGAFFEGFAKEVYFDYGVGEIRINVDLDEDSVALVDRLLEPHD